MPTGMECTAWEYAQGLRCCRLFMAWFWRTQPCNNMLVLPVCGFGSCLVRLMVEAGKCMKTWSKRSKGAVCAYGFFVICKWV